MADDLAIWTVYDHPLDYPDKFVARKSLISSDGVKQTSTVIWSPDLEVVRETLARDGLVCLERSPDDDPVIVECWI